MKIFAILICAITVATVLAKGHDEWKSFKAAYGKHYENEAEETRRKSTFMDNLKIIKEHNDHYDEGELTFKLGINKFADMTVEEFVSKIYGHQINSRPKGGKKPEDIRQDTTNDTVNWPENGCPGYGNVDQGQCGASWAFSTNLMDCTWSYGNVGCNGGLIDNAYQYVIDNGIDTEASYPYEDQSKPNNCRYNPANAVHISGYVDVPFADEDVLKSAVTTGPVAAAIDGSHVSFQLYQSGVYNEPLCSETQLDLYVMVEGYGVDNGINYWLVEPLNFGPLWGENGFIEMTRDGSNQCGIASAANYPII